MKKVFLVVFAISIFSAGSVFATSFSTTLLGTPDDANHVGLCLWHDHSFKFNILDQFNPETQDVLSAQLSFVFSDKDSADETVKISAGSDDGNTLLRRKTYNLGSGSWWCENKRTTATLEFNLANLDFTQDGLFTSVVFMPYEGGFDFSNSIRIESVTFSGVASAPVPEPSTILLFGAGLAGLVGYSRKRSNKKA